MPLRTQHQIFAFLTGAAAASGGYIATQVLCERSYCSSKRTVQRWEQLPRPPRPWCRGTFGGPPQILRQ